MELPAMDMEMIVISTVVAALVAAAVYITSLFGAKETTFEEAIARQKQNHLSEQLLGAKGKSNNKSNKGKKKGTAASAAATAPSATATGGDNPNKNKKKQNNKNKKQQKKQEEEEVEVQDQEEEIAQSPEPEPEPEVEVEVVEVTAPVNTNSTSSSVVDESEVKVTGGKGKGKKKATAAAVKVQQEIEPETKVAELAAVAEQVQALAHAPPQQAIPAPSVPSKQEKKKGQGQGGRHNVLAPSGAVRAPPSGDLSTVQLEDALVKAQLSSSDIQTLIDILLNKQQHRGSSDWVSKSKNDTVATLKKQLSDKEQQSANDHATISTLQSKIKELRSEFTGERAVFTQTRRALEETANAKKLELSSLQARFQKLADSSAEEKAHLIQQFQQAQGTLRALQSENAGIKTALARQEEERAKGDSSGKEDGPLREQCTHLENQLLSALTANKDLGAQIQTLTHSVTAIQQAKEAELKALHESYATQLREREEHLVAELRKGQTLGKDLEGETLGLKKEISAQVATIEDLNRKAQDAEKRLMVSQTAEKKASSALAEKEKLLAELENKLTCKDSLLHNLTEENKNLESQVLTLTQSNGKGASSPEAELSHKLREEFADLQERLNQYEGKIATLDTDKKNLLNDSETVKLDLKVQKEKNQELLQMTNTLTDKLRRAESELKGQMSKVETITKEAVATTLKESEAALKTTFKTLFPEADFDQGKGDWKESFVSQIREKLNTNVAQNVQANKSDEEEIKSYQEKVKAIEERLHSQVESSQKKEEELRGKVEATEKQLAEAHAHAQALIASNDEELKTSLKNALPGLSLEGNWKTTIAASIAEKLKANSNSNEELSSLSTKVKEYEVALESKEALLKTHNATELELRTKLEKLESELSAARAANYNTLKTEPVVMNGQHKETLSPAKETNGHGHDLSPGLHTPNRSLTPDASPSPSPSPSSPQLSSPSGGSGTSPNSTASGRESKSPNAKDKDQSKDKDKKSKKGSTKKSKEV